MEGELRGVRSVLPAAEDAIYMVEIADAIFKSINTRQTVQVG
jgi:predicted dehydrogenase